jgi:HAE1 family hydrophobic/amphiphilic exporter-1
MTSFAFIAGLIPLVMATGAGALGNRTIGTTGVGGMLMGTVVGVLVIPGLYFLFAQLADNKKLLRDETTTPYSEQWSGDSLPPDEEIPDELPPTIAPDGPAQSDENAPSDEDASSEHPSADTKKEDPNHE